MTKKFLTTHVVKPLQALLEPHGFIILDSQAVDLSSEGGHIEFTKLSTGGTEHHFSVHIGKYGRITSVNLSASFEPLTKIQKELVSEYQLDNRGWLASSVSVANYLAAKNNLYSSLLNKHVAYVEEVRIGSSDQEASAAVQRLYREYFLAAMPRYLEETESVEKIDALLNKPLVAFIRQFPDLETAIAAPMYDSVLVHFMGDQQAVSLLSAYVVQNPDLPLIYQFYIQRINPHTIFFKKYKEEYKPFFKLCRHLGFPIPEHLHKYE